MAKVRNISKSTEGTKLRGKITETDLEYSISEEGNLFIIRTFGSDVRKEVGKASQAIHLDKNKASELANILNDWVK